MRDTEIVASIVGGDPDGLAAAYDRYADSLYTYCRSLLGDPADAADAVQDTFVIAASRLDRLHDADRLRAWLYSLARNECLRIPRSRKGTSAPGEAPEVTGAADLAEDAERAGLRRLFEDATAGLNPDEREVIELQLRQGLAPAEVAAVLGVSPGQAQALLSRARGQLEACLGVLLVGRAGRADCAALGSLLTGWDGRLTVPLRERVHRHIEQCATCASRRALELRPAMLFDLSPGAAMAAAAAESLRTAAGAPADLKAHTLALATGHGPAAAAHSAAVLGRAGAFSRQGFPKAARHGAARADGRHGRHRGGAGRFLRTPWGRGAAAAAVIAVAAAVAAFTLTGNSGHLRPAAAAKPSTTASQAPPPATATSGQGPGRGTPPPPATAVLASTPPPLTTPSQAATSAKPRPSPATTATPTSARPSPTPTKPATTPTSTPTPTPTPGSLSQFPPGGTAARPFPLFVAPNGDGASLRLTASGSGSDWAVTWLVTVAGDPDGVLSVSPATSGTLIPASPDTTLTITASRYIQCGTRRSPACPTITISPGGAVYTVWTGWGRGFSGAGMPAALLRVPPGAHRPDARRPGPHPLTRAALVRTVPRTAPVAAVPSARDRSATRRHRSVAHHYP